MKIVIITPAHNEENNIEKCIRSVKDLNVPNGIELEHVVVLDRCTDNTGVICKKYNVKTLEKNWRGNYVSSIAEAVEFGVKNTVSDYVGKVDADVKLPKVLITELMPYFDDETVSVSCNIKTRTGKKWLDFFMWIRDLNFKIAPFGIEARGGARLINRKLLKEIGSFDRDKPTWDTAFDQKARKQRFKIKNVSSVTAIEFRKLSVDEIVRHQISAGRARRALGVGFFRTLLHAIFRGRPFVLWGYLSNARGARGASST